MDLIDTGMRGVMLSIWQDFIDKLDRITTPVRDVRNQVDYVANEYVCDCSLTLASQLGHHLTHAFSNPNMCVQSGPNYHICQLDHC